MCNFSITIVFVFKQDDINYKVNFCIQHIKPPSKIIPTCKKRNKRIDNTNMHVNILAK